MGGRGGGRGQGGGGREFRGYRGLGSLRVWGVCEFNFSMLLEYVK